MLHLLITQRLCARRQAMEISPSGHPRGTSLALSAKAPRRRWPGINPGPGHNTAILDRYPDHYLAARCTISQARLLELSGNISSASTVYDRFVILYPRGPWIALRAPACRSCPPPPNPPIQKYLFLIISLTAISKLSIIRANSKRVHMMTTSELEPVAGADW